MNRPANNIVIGILVLVAAAVIASMGYGLVGVIVAVVAVLILLGWLG